jgi:hypothetical protein
MCGGVFTSTRCAPIATCAEIMCQVFSSAMRTTVNPSWRGSRKRSKSLRNAWRLSRVVLKTMSMTTGCSLIGMRFRPMCLGTTQSAAIHDFRFGSLITAALSRVGTATSVAFKVSPNLASDASPRSRRHAPPRWGFREASGVSKRSLKLRSMFAWEPRGCTQRAAARPPPVAASSLSHRIVGRPATPMLPPHFWNGDHRVEYPPDGVSPAIQGQPAHAQRPWIRRPAGGSATTKRGAAPRR